MATKAVLDVTRRRLIEPDYFKHTYARDIQTNAYKNLMYKWATGSWTLQPLNSTSDFAESNSWESLKFRLSDVTYDPNYLTEYPDNTRADVGPCDYFMSVIMKAANVNVGFPSAAHPFLIESAIDAAIVAVLGLINYQQTHGVVACQSLFSLPANQGYVLRFRIDGRENTARGGVMDFYFADFALRINSDGSAMVFQTADFVNYAFVYSWMWADFAQVHNRAHQITIFPHARNKIEFWARTGAQDHLRYQAWLKSPGNNKAGMYEIPGEIVAGVPGQTISNSNVTPTITQPGYWSMRVSREYRATFQVSRLGFANGGSGNAFVYDSPSDIGHPVVGPISVSTEYDAPVGTTANWNIINADNPPNAFVSDGTQSKPQFWIAMQGLGDIAGPGLGSSFSPEFYGYALSKPALFQTITRAPVVVSTLGQSLDSGESPEGERLTLILDNPPVGSVTAPYATRADIPLQLIDNVTGAVLFEGNSHKVESSEDPASEATTIQIEAIGMAEDQIRTYWSASSPDFGKDPKDSNHRGWLVGDVIRQCYESSGVPSVDVVIEEEADYLRNFRLWTDPDVGGQEHTLTDLQIAARGLFRLLMGDGFVPEEGIQRRWRPRPNSSIYEYIDWFVRSVLGWNFARSKADQKWHIYRRPNPLNALDVSRGKFLPQVEFTSLAHPASGLLPNYPHAKLKRQVTKPWCTTVILVTIVRTSDIPSKAALNTLLGNTAAGTSSPADPAFVPTPRRVLVPFDNKQGYPNAFNNSVDFPNLLGHPDFMGARRELPILCIEANTLDAINWFGRRLYDDLTHGYTYRTFEADWGDIYTYNLRKWDVVSVNGTPWYIDRIEPHWSGGGSDVVRRARYRVSQYRSDAPPPR
jgi:hypothetical protein